MKIAKCPSRFKYFNALSLSEQARIGFHVSVLGELLGREDVEQDELSAETFQILSLSDALLCASSQAPESAELWVLVWSFLKHEVREQHDFAVDVEKIDRFTVAECVVHMLILAAASQSSPMDLLAEDRFATLVGQVFEDDRGFGTAMLDLRAVTASTIWPLLANPESGNLMRSAGKAIAVLQAHLEDS